MTKNIEAIASIYRRHGWEHQARELGAVAERFKAQGMPEYLELDRQEEAKQEPVQALKRQLVEILAAETIDPKRPKGKMLLTSVLAAKLNLVGQKFDDSTPLSELTVKERGSYVEFHVPGQPVIGEDQRYEIQHGIATAFNKLLNKLQYYGPKTIGEVRSASPRDIYQEIYNRRGPGIYLSPYGIQFLKDAVARLPHTRPSGSKPLTNEV